MKNQPSKQIIITKLSFLKKFEKEKINIFYSFKSILWQGPSLINKIEEKLKKKKKCKFYR